MGCDIHAFIEYRNPNSEYKSWNGFGKEFHLWRNYLMFGVLAGVRAYEIKPVVAPRGVPKDVAYSAVGAYTYYIIEDKDYNTDLESNITSRTKAEHSVASGYAEWWDEKHTRITSSDYHTGSWLTTKEYEKSLSNYRMEADGEGPPAEYNAVLAAMQLFESEGFEARLVFWFDN